MPVTAGVKDVKKINGSFVLMSKELLLSEHLVLKKKGNQKYRKQMPR